jgi:hypothetical protein
MSDFICFQLNHFRNVVQEIKQNQHAFGRIDDLQDVFAYQLAKFVGQAKEI